MMHHRPWILLLLAGCSWAHVSLAQTGGETGGGGATGAGGTGTGGTGGSTTGGATTAPSTPPPATTNPFDPAASGGTTTPKKDPFGFGEFTPSGGTGGTSPFGTGGGATTTFGVGPREGTGPNTPADPAETTEPMRPKEQPITYTAPGFYGSGGQTFSSGQGRFLRPRFRYSASVSMGFDDNTLQTPTDSTATTLVIPEQPEISRTVPVREQTGVQFIGGAFRPVFRTVQQKVVLQPFIPEQVITTPAQERNESIVSSVNAQLSVQWAKQRSLFIFDLNLGGDYYWNRDEKPLEYTGSLSLVYLRKITPRMQFTTSVSLAYQSQPDYSQANLDPTLGSSGGSYFNGTAKMDLSYRWGPRFSTVSSITANGTSYELESSKLNDVYGATLGQEFRYIWSPHYTWVGELRYGFNTYVNALDRDYNDVFLLLGTDWTWSRRLRGTIRLGEQLRKFEVGGNSTAPYAEVSAIYQTGSRSQLIATSRYGFEPTQRVGEENIAFRANLAYSRAFSPRLSGNVGINYVTNAITSELGSDDTTNIYDTNLSLNYTFSRRFSLSGRYSYTLRSSTTGTSDYDRSRLFFTGQYEF